MAASKIEWTNTTWNPIVGCAWASAGCDACYAATMARRLEAMGNRDYAGLTSKKHFNGTVRTLEHRLADPLKWRKPRRVFVNSMSDLFHPDVPFEFIDRVFAVMALCPQHAFQILTKRPERMAEYLNMPRRAESIYGDWFVKLRDDNPRCARDFYETWGQIDPHYDPSHPLARKNWWLMTSCENQQTADERIPHLLRCPAAVRGLSLEPLLGDINLRPYFAHSIRCERCPGPGMNGGEPCRCPRIHWVIVGGESGPNARPMHPDWARSLRDQCVSAGVPFFFKQWGEFLPGEVRGDIFEGQDGVTYNGVLLKLHDNYSPSGFWYRVGKKHAGRLLDGREWRQYPEATR